MQEICIFSLEKSISGAIISEEFNTNKKNMDFSKAGELMKLQQEAMKVKKELENTLIEAEVDGLVVTVNGEMKVEKVEFETDTLIGDKAALEKAIAEAVNKGMKKAQEVAGDKMQGVMQGMGMGDMMGGLPGGM
jgi:DNA-binding protein YbaB